MRDGFWYCERCDPEVTRARARRAAEGHALLVETVEAMIADWRAPSDRTSDEAFVNGPRPVVGEHRALMRALGMVRGSDTEGVST